MTCGHALEESIDHPRQDRQAIAASPTRRTAFHKPTVTVMPPSRRRCYIGFVRAQIIDYRDWIGGSTEVGQLRDVFGIGERAFQSLAAHVSQ